jgi:hypothetical protein
MRKLWPMGFIFETEEGNIVLTDKGCFDNALSGVIYA